MAAAQTPADSDSPRKAPGPYGATPEYTARSNRLVWERSAPSVIVNGPPLCSVTRPVVCHRRQERAARRVGPGEASKSADTMPVNFDHCDFRSRHGRAGRIGDRSDKLTRILRYAGGKQNSAAHNTNEVFLYVLPKTIASIR